MDSKVGLFSGLPYLPDPDGLAHAFRELLDTKWLTNRGPLVQRFEAEIKCRLRNDDLHVVTTANATLGLELTLRALQLRGKVIVTPLTFAATAHAIVNCGLEPVFADVAPHDFCLAPAAVERALTPDVCAVMPVHVYGHVCDVAYFARLRERGIRVIYDAAHAFGVEHQGIPVGNFGDAEVFSFHASKIVNACEGGAVVTHDATLAEKILRMTNFGFADEDEVAQVGTNAKLSEVHALFGLSSLAHLPSAIALRRALIARYRETLVGLPALVVPPPQPHVTPNGQFFSILLSHRRLRDALHGYLKERNVFSRRYFYPPLHRMPPYAASVTQPLEVAEAVSDRVLCLPLHPGLHVDQVDLVCREISEFLKSAG